MPVVVVQVGAAGAQVVVPRQETTTTTAASTKEAPNPILPVGNEIWWGLGSFLALVLLMRVWLFPKLKKGMLARNAKIQGDLDDAERIREEAAEDVAAYEAALAEARGEAARILEVARHEVDSDRTAKLTAANGRIAEQRAAATAELEAARTAALGQAEEIVVEVSAVAGERILGKPVDRTAVRPLVSEVVRAEVPA